MAKKLKLPQLNDETKILSFDLETNGLHGKAFAVGAVVIDAKGKIHDQFTGRTKIQGKTDEWVKEQVLPVIGDMDVDYESYQDLREAFWQWYLKAESKSDYVLVNNGYPAEYRFLLDCQEADLENRYWQHPFPILELASLLIQIGVSKKNFAREFLENSKRKPHHPLHDATVAAQTAFKALKQAGQLNY